MKEFEDWSLSCAVKNEGLHQWQIQGAKMNYVSSSHNFLYENDIYVLLQTIELYDGKLEHHLHIWVGSGASEEDVRYAERQAAALDVLLYRRTTLHWERQEHECELFISYFRPAVQYLPGKCPLITMKDQEIKENMLFSVYPLRNMNKIKQVKCDMSSLNKRDPLILVTDVIYVLPRGSWNHQVLYEIGSLIALQLMLNDPRFIDIPSILLDKYAATEDWDEFYKALGWEDPDSFPDIPDGPLLPQTETQDAPELYEILRNRRGHIYYRNMSYPFHRNALNSKSLYILVNGKDNACLWIGKKNQDRNKKHMTIVPEGLEPISFKRHFHDWFGLD